MSGALIIGGGVLILGGVAKQIGDAIKSRRLAPPLPPGALTRQFDPLWQAEPLCRGIPIEYLRALTKWESGFEPGNTSGAAWGLMEIVPGLLNEYNRVNGTSFERTDLLDPELNVRVGCFEISRAVRSYISHHADVFPPGQRWTSPRFVQLVTFGWNAGWTERRGVGYVLHQLKRQMAPQTITIDDVHAYAKTDPVASRFLAERTPDWSRKVTRQYFIERNIARRG